VRRAPGWRRRLHRWLFPVVLALRMVPLLLDEARRLVDVDRLRRGPGRRGPGWRRTASLAPLFIVLVVERAEALALALSLRGYHPARERPFLRAWRMDPLDWGLVVVGTLGVLALRRGP
jgi:energy-coupling factor transporter transmembrane protein EcfT